MFYDETRMTTVIADYVFIDGDGNLRTKNKAVIFQTGDPFCFEDFTTDGSSTKQASEDGNTEIILRPVYHIKNPLKPVEAYLVVCETYDAITNLPLSSNTRAKVAELYNNQDVKDLQIWFGQEQEYYLVSSDNNKSYEGPHYCSVVNNPIQQQIVDEHMIVCMLIDVRFYGTNSEVSPNQWEFQLGPCEGLRAADNLLIARFLLEKIAAKHGYSVCYHPKPFHDRHGSGCHHNFSTKATREVGGYDAIVELMSRFAETHTEHIAAYGTGNEFRLTGKCETASMNAFSWGVGTRNTSMRVPNKTQQLGYGYIEDRRPAANVDPYDALYMITKTIK